MVKSFNEYDIVPTERILLSVLIRESRHLPEELTTKDFIEPQHRKIVEAFESLRELNIQPDEITITQKLRENNSGIDAVTISLMSSEYEFKPLNPAWINEIISASDKRVLEKNLSSALENLAKPGADTEIIKRHLREVTTDNSRTSKQHKAFIDKDVLLGYDKSADSNCLIGNRLLCKEGSLLISGQSGIGKSSLMMQLAIECATGGNFFGIKVARPLRTIIVQAENDNADLGEQFRGVVSGLKLSAEMEKQMMVNLDIKTDSESSGLKFLDSLQNLVEREKPDIVFIDPLFSFAGFDLNNQEQVSHFLRRGLLPIQKQYGTIMAVVHHTTKPRSDSIKNNNHNFLERAYLSHGSAELINYFREVMVLTQITTKSNCYELSLTKRRNRSGMCDESGKLADIIRLKHSSDPSSMFWEHYQDNHATQKAPENPF